MRWARRISIAIAAPYVVLGFISAYRAWVQVKSLDVSVSSPVAVGSRIDVRTVSWARTFVTTRVILEQPPAAETLLVERLGMNNTPSLDPRTRSGEWQITLTDASLSSFHPGLATLRAIAIGGPQWLRTPPPLVRAIRIVVQPVTRHL
jgi:hypothetical protein